MDFINDFKEIKKFNDNKLAVMKNDAVEAIYDMNLNQLKLFIALVSLIEKGDTKFTQYKIDAKALANIFNLSNTDNIYLVSDRVTDGLIKRSMAVKDKIKQEYIKYSIFSEISYKDGILTVSFNEKMIPFLLDLKENFTKFRLKEIKPFKSKYALRIYQLLKQYQAFSDRIFDVDELRTILDIQSHELKNFNDFKKRVIDIAQRELKDTPMAFNWEIVEKAKKGKVTKIKFTLINTQQKESLLLPDEVKNLLKATKTQATPEQLQQEQSSQQQDSKQEYQQKQSEQKQSEQKQSEQKQSEQKQPKQSSQELSVLEDEEILKQFKELYSLIPQQYKNKVLDNLISKYIKDKGYLYVKQNVEYVLNQKNVKNFMVYLSKSLANDWGYAAASEIEAKLKQDEAKRFFDLVKENTFEKNDILWTPVNCIYSPEKQKFVLECIGYDNEGKPHKRIYESDKLYYLARALKWTEYVDMEML